MLRLTSGPALVVEIGLAVFCALDALLADEAAVRWIPRWAWVLYLLAFPLCGSISWIVAGHPWRCQQRRAHWADELTVPGAPADPGPPGAGPATPRPGVQSRDPVGAAGPGPPSAAADGPWRAIDVEHHQILRQWEADLRRREAALRAARRTPGQQ